MQDNPVSRGETRDDLDRLVVAMADLNESGSRAPIAHDEGGPALPFSE